MTTGGQGKCAYCLKPINSGTYSYRFNVLCCDPECLCLYVETQEQVAHYLKGGDSLEAEKTLTDTPETIGQ